MEVSGEGHSDENKHSSDNKKRRLKTPAQLIALEKFYDEHKYPTEEMKAELAVQLGLTEKQISGWFCHRRLKDKRSSKEEKCPNGRQERLSGVIQDLGQDSCGSTKHTDYRHVDLREVESRRLYGPDFQAANPIRENRIHHYIERVARVDHETSSESSSSLQDRLVSQLEDHHGGETSRYLSHDGLISTPLNPKGSRHIRYKPSGYLKVKGEVENAAITAVKRQLGRQYQEDGPLLGVDFDPLPPGAFESPPRDPIHEAYYVGNSVHSHSPDIAGLKRQLSPQSRYDEYNSKLSSRDMYLQEAPGISHGPGTQKPAYFDHTCSLADRNSALGVYDESNNKIPKKRKKGVKKHSVDGIASDSYLNHQVTSGGRIYSKPIVPWLHEKDNSLSPKMVQRSGYSNFKPRLIARDYCETPDMEERRISVMMPQQESKLHGDYRSMKDVAVKMKPAGEMAGKRVRVEFPQQENCTSPALDERLSRKNHAKGSGLEIPSSFSEDETAETSSSAEDLE